ncbi:type II toxin-antitoxin system death-on-curing family toxin [bacterium]|nr:type II toxin-antitoxin system death-on-curing family toxin [bacterium]
MRFVPLPAVMVMHAGLLREFGGQTGLRDKGLLESALDRPKNLYYHQEASIFQLAASYTFDLVKNHPFVDGNKRVGLLCSYSFLSLNGVELTAPEEEAVVVINGVADGSVDEATLTIWFQTNSQPITPQK